MRFKEIMEGLRDPKDNPCWKGYKPVGTKKKGGRTVPNCVPKESVAEGRAGIDDTDTVGFSVNSEAAYTAVMRRFGDYIDHDETSGIMWAPARIWPQIEMTAFDADPDEGAVRVEDDVMEHGDPWEDPDYDPRGSGKETRSPEQIAKDRAEHAVLSKELGLSNKNDKDSVISDLTKMLNYHLGGKKTSKKPGDVSEGKGLAQRVRVVKTGETGTIRQIKHGAYKGAPKTYYVDLDNGGQADNLPASALRLIKGEVAEDSERLARLKAARSQGKSIGDAYSDLKDLEGTAGKPSDRAAKLKAARSQGKSMGQAYASLGDTKGVAEGSEGLEDDHDPKTRLAIKVIQQNKRRNEPLAYTHAIKHLKTQGWSDRQIKNLEQGVAEGEEQGTFAALKGWQQWNVLIMNNFYNGRYPDYSARMYGVVASSPEEARQVVLDNADYVLKDLLTRKTPNGKRWLPPKSAVPIEDKRVGGLDRIKPGSLTTMGFKTMLTPDGPKNIKFSNGQIVDVQGEESAVAEEVWQSDYARRRQQERDIESGKKPWQTKFALRRQRDRDVESGKVPPRPQKSLRSGR